MGDAMVSENKGLYYLVCPSGDFDTTSVAEIRDIAKAAFETGQKNIVFDLSRCEGIDSTAIGLLANLCKKCDSLSGFVGVMHPSTRITSLIIEAGLDKLLRLYLSEDQIRIELEEEGSADT